MHEDTTVSLSRFAELIGLTRQRLHILNQQGRGPAVIDRGPGRLPRYLVNVEGGMEWARLRKQLAGARA